MLPQSNELKPMKVEREPSFVQMTLAKYRRNNVINTRKPSSIGYSHRGITR